MSLASRVNSLATRIGQEVKSLWTAVNGKAASDHGDHGLATHAASSTAHPRDARNQIAGSYAAAVHSHSYLPLAGGTLDGGESTLLKILADNGGEAVIELMGDVSSQSTGRVYVGQSPSHGGGILYNGDGTPDYCGVGSDVITLYRVSGGVPYWTAKNSQGSNDWYFRGMVSALYLNENGVNLSAKYAALNSPALTGSPTAPTQGEADNSTKLATTAFVKAAVAALVDSSPAALDTLNELAAALGDDPNFATTMTNALAGKEASFSKNSAFNKNFGTASGTVCQGNDSRLSNQRTPTDASVTYAKVANALKSRATDNDGSWDFSANAFIDAAFSSGSTTVALSNVQAGKCLKVKLVITNSATFTLPASCTVLDGSAEASGENGTYFLYFDAWSTTEILVSIAKAA